jgi:phosphomannomutase/phosphomannomutase/phosphoglucomutase
MQETTRLESFKAYDVRGRVPDQLNVTMAALIGRAYAELIHPARVVIGHDVRLTSPELAAALAGGLVESGVDVIDIGLVGTEEVYHATFALGLDGGIMVTASHNPREYNGMKFTREHARPISSDTGLLEIEQMVREAMSGGGIGSAAGAKPGVKQGTIERLNMRMAFVEHLLTYIDPAGLRPLKVVVNPGNGGAGPVIDMLEKELPSRFVKINHTPDGTFPLGVPNPLLPENRAVTSRAVLETGADVGIAWDGDFDRCFFFDEKGGFVEGYYLVGLLAERALKRHPGANIVHDPRLVWNTEELVCQAGGTPVVCKSGHAFIKEKMRAVDGAYGGEMSAHHYFREFSYCDSGMIPWLQVVEAISEAGRPLSEMVEERIARFPVSGEINLTLEDPGRALDVIRDRYAGAALDVDETDGLSIEYPSWRFNVRMSNTEPVVRLNVETRADRDLLQARTAELIAALESAR